MVEATRAVSRLAWRDGRLEASERRVPEETAVALVYDGGTYAVMMASPTDLEDFAIGFSLTEGIIAQIDDIAGFEYVEHGDGLEARLWLKPERAQRLATRRRATAGPTGCGLCGIDSLGEALRVPPRIETSGSATPDEVHAALRALTEAQSLGKETRAVHAAAFWQRTGGLVELREDVGRHNALDKLVGALARQARLGQDGLVVLTSRVSIEMVQKACTLGAPILVAVSAPTALAIRAANAAGLTLAGIAREDGFEIFTHPHRLSSESFVDVA